MKPHTRLALSAQVLGAVAFTFGVSGCASSAAPLLGQHPTEQCSDEEANAYDTKPTTERLYVLVDVDNNNAQSAAGIAAGVHDTLDQDLTNQSKVQITGFTYGGVGQSPQPISCMSPPHNQYSFDTNNGNRNTNDRNMLIKELQPTIQDAVQSTQVAPTGDPRPLLAQLASDPQSGGPGTHIILWSSFLSQGTDCLALSSSDQASSLTAQRVADRCASNNLLPDLHGAQLTIVGAGQDPTRPSVSSFGRALASDICNDMTDPSQCEVQ